MKDIDFDELDRAVSSVLGQTTPKKSDVSLQSAQDPVISKTDVSEPTQIVDQSKTTAPSPAPVNRPNKPENDAVVVRKQPVIQPDTTMSTKRRGRIMDVMHPTTTQKAVRTAHSPVKLAPIEAPPHDDESATVSGVESSEPIAIVDEANALIGAAPSPVENVPSSISAETNDIPEQTDLTEPSQILRDETPDQTDSVRSDTKLSEEAHLDDNDLDGILEDVPSTAPSTLESTIPQTSPFLDTKVDKRPLGGDTFTPNSDDSQHSVEPEPELEMPRELQPDVVEVESSQGDTKQTQAQSENPFATHVEAAPEPEADDRVEGHPLFDTSTYHEPIQPVQAKSGMPGWLVWVIGLSGCLAVGAGVGYFLFNAGV